MGKVSPDLHALLEGKQPDMDVYDAASWSAVSELSERSVAHKSRPVDFPDFTRGAWEKKSKDFYHRYVTFFPQEGQ